MRVRFLLTTLLLAAAAAPALAGTPQLTSNSRASVVGGGAGGAFDNHTLSPASAGTALMSGAIQTSLSGAYAHANATSEFGAAHVYADGYVPFDPEHISNSQAQGYAEFYDYFSGGGLYTLTFAINGSHTPTDGLISITADANFNYTVKDTTTNEGITFGNWTSTDASPDAIIKSSFTLAAGHAFELRVMFDADTYTINNSPGPGGVGYGVYPVVSNYSDTLKVFVDGAGGGPIFGQSGHDYATPEATEDGVPEPALWALTLVGFGVTSLRLRGRALPA